MQTTDEYLKYLNLARENPSHYLPLIQKLIASFINQKEIKIDEELIYQTNQGKSALIKARKFLTSQKSLLPVQKHQGLCRSATDHLKDICKNRIFGQKGSDGSDVLQRIKRHCKLSGAMAQVLGFDFDNKDRNTAQMTILSIIIDDGVKTRVHRNQIFSPSFKYVGWGSAKHDQKIITVFDLSEDNLQTYSETNH